MLLSSLGAVLPAPTRAIYTSTKAASLLLYQSLSIEHPSIKFSIVIPSTIKSAFRSSAVDGPPIRDGGENLVGLDKVHVAKKCIDAIDYGKKFVFLPSYHMISVFFYWLWPSFVEKQASKKYYFVPKAPVF
jgi:short-subunit dehydrogenase